MCTPNRQYRQNFGIGGIVSFVGSVGLELRWTYYCAGGDSEVVSVLSVPLVASSIFSAANHRWRKSSVTDWNRTSNRSSTNSAGRIPNAFFPWRRALRSSIPQLNNHVRSRTSVIRSRTCRLIRIRVLLVSQMLI